MYYYKVPWPWPWLDYMGIIGWIIWIQQAAIVIFITVRIMYGIACKRTEQNFQSENAQDADDEVWAQVSLAKLKVHQGAVWCAGEESSMCK